MSLPRSTHGTRYRVLLVIVTGLLYYLAARIGLLWAQADGVASIVWPAAGVAVAGAILVGWPAMLAVIAATFLANYTSGQPGWVNFSIALGNGLAAWLAWVLLGRRGFDPRFHHSRDVIRFTFLGVLPPAGLAATVGVGAIALAGTGNDLSGLWLGWVIGDAVGIMILAPVLLTWSRDRLPLGPRKLLLLGVCLAAAIFLSWAIFISEGLPQLRTYVLFPLLILAALLLKARGASLVVLAVAVLAVWDTSMAATLPEPPPGITGTVLGTQQFLGLVGLTILLLAAVSHERDRLHELRVAERLLQGSEERLNVALEASGMGDWSWDMTTDTVRFSPRAAEIFGLGPRQFITWTQLRQLIPDAERKRVIMALEDAIAQKREYDVEYPVDHGDGQVVWIATRGRAQYDGGTPIGMVGVVQDVTQRRIAEADLRRAKEQAEAANAAKDQFLAVLSHELRTPLTPVLTLSELLRQRQDLPAEVAEDLETIRRNILLEARLIDDLLDLTGIARGKLEIQLAQVDFHESVRHVLAMVEPEAAARQLCVDLELNATRPTVRGDPARLQQIVWNLLKNAIKFTASGGRIRIRSSDAAERLRLEVIDNGIGIEPEVMPRIFAAFEQGDANITRQFGGLGLGLAISKALVDLHGGTLSAFSRGRGTGATLTLELPAVPVAQAASSRGANGHPAALAASLCILLVEDHEDTARIMTRLLRRAGHQVRRAASVAQALEAAEDGHVDIVISDLGLPDGSGHELMGRLRQHHRIRGVAVSGYGMEEDIRRSREAGFEDHLVKPVSLQQLESVLRRVAGNEDGG